MNMGCNKRLFWMLMGSLGILLLGSTALAGEGAKDWRPTYDLIMRIVNFLILVIIIVKFGRAPLGNFLRGKKEEISSEIKQMEEKKKTAESQLKEVNKMLEESNERFELLKQRIIRQGELKKREIIDEARLESRIMLEGAKKKTDHRIAQAKNAFRSELIDSAIDIAMKTIPKEMKKEDNDKLLKQFLAETEKD